MPSIKLGNSTPTGIYLGSNPVNAIYLGSTLVWGYPVSVESNNASLLNNDDDTVTEDS